MSDQTVPDAADTPEVEPALVGPYDDANGQCAQGHPVNSYGRCQPLNEGTGE